MARTALIVGAAAALGLGIADLSYLNLRLVPEVLGKKPSLTTDPIAFAMPVAEPDEPPDEPPLAEPDQAPVDEASGVPDQAPVDEAVVETDQAPVLAETDQAPVDEAVAEPDQAPVDEPDELPERVVLRFPSASARLSSQAEARLDQLADELVHRDELHLVIAGHADERGSAAYNHDLGERRAERVARYLEGRGVSGDRMTRRSFGELRPAAEGRDPASLRRNRRVEIVVKRGQP